MEQPDEHRTNEGEYGLDLETQDSHLIIRWPNNKLRKVVWNRPDGSKHQTIEYDEKGNPVRVTMFEKKNSEITTDQVTLEEVNKQAEALLNESGEF